jgi:hypothetical protein
MEIKNVKITELVLNDQNPRFIKDHKFKKLVESIKSFEKMLDIRPIVVDENMVILGGNMRFRACREAGLKKIPVMIVENLTDAEKNEFMIKDNVGFGEWNFDMLANTFDSVQLVDWGMDVPRFDIDPDEIIDIMELDEINETCQFIIECSNIDEFKIVQSKLQSTGKKIHFDKFVEWHEKNCVN